MLRLIVSEKPSMGRAIAAALGIQGSGRSAIQGQGVIVTWCVGHLVEAIAPEGYDPALKSWRMEALPFFPDPFRYAPIAATREQFQTVAGLMNRQDVDEIVNATDAGGGRTDLRPGLPPGRSRQAGAAVLDLQPHRRGHPRGLRAMKGGEATRACGTPPAAGRRRTGWWGSTAPGPRPWPSAGPGARGCARWAGCRRPPWRCW